jgi:hypothetical protein
MTVEELRAFKSELQQLNIELKNLKRQLLVTRTEQLERTIRVSERKGHLRLSGKETVA